MVCAFQTSHSERVSLLFLHSVDLCSLLWGVSSVCSCSCALSWEFQRLCWDDRGKGLFVCLIVWFWLCTGVSVLINPRCSAFCESLGRAGRSQGSDGRDKLGWQSCERGFKAPSQHPQDAGKALRSCAVFCVAERSFPCAAQLCSSPAPAPSPAIGAALSSAGWALLICVQREFKNH